MNEILAKWSYAGRGCRETERRENDVSHTCTRYSAETHRLTIFIYSSFHFIKPRSLQCVLQRLFKRDRDAKFRNFLLSKFSKRQCQLTLLRRSRVFDLASERDRKRERERERERETERETISSIINLICPIACTLAEMYSLTHVRDAQYTTTINR